MDESDLKDVSQAKEDVEERNKERERRIEIMKKEAQSEEIKSKVNDWFYNQGLSKTDIIFDKLNWQTPPGPKGYCQYLPGAVNLFYDLIDVDGKKEYKKEQQKVYKKNKEERAYNNEFTEEKKELVKEADGHKCKLCGKSDCKLDVHHILDEDDKRYNEPKFLITLCSECHGLVERGASLGNWNWDKILDYAELLKEELNFDPWEVLSDHTNGSIEIIKKTYGGNFSKADILDYWKENYMDKTPQEIEPPGTAKMKEGSVDLDFLFEKYRCGLCGKEFISDEFGGEHAFECSKLERNGGDKTLQDVENNLEKVSE